MLHELIQTLAHSLPLEAFVFIGSYLEEVIAPIPSPSIMVIAGSFGAIQKYVPHELALLVLIASIGKTLGGLTMYALARHARGPLLRMLGRVVSITEDELAAFGKRFNGSLRDYGVYIFLRALPLIPSIVLSFGSGAVGLSVRLFIIGTFVGTLIRDAFYLIVGFSGTAYLHTLLGHTTQIETYGTYLVLGVFIVCGAYYVRHKRKGRSTPTS